MEAVAASDDDHPGSAQLDRMPAAEWTHTARSDAERHGRLQDEKLENPTVGATRKRAVPGQGWTKDSERGRAARGSALRR